MTQEEFFTTHPRYKMFRRLWEQSIWKKWKPAIILYSDAQFTYKTDEAWKAERLYWCENRCFGRVRNVLSGIWEFEHARDAEEFRKVWSL